jgi:hypothetical protein
METLEVLTKRMFISAKSKARALASLTMLMYAPATTGAPAGSDMQAPFSMNGAPVRLNVQKTENGFDLSGVSDAHSETRYEFKAERVADLLAD